MKRMLMLSLAAFFFLSTAAMAEVSNPYVGLFADSYHTECSVIGYMYSTFEVWLWWFPGPGGIHGVECGIELPSNMVGLGRVFNPDVPLYIVPCCTDDGDCRCDFMSCHTDWVYLFRQSVLLLTAEPSIIKIVAYPGSEGVNVGTCEIGSIVPATILNNLHVNQPCFVAVETSTWGAIKDFYR